MMIAQETRKKKWDYILTGSLQHFKCQSKLLVKVNQVDNSTLIISP